jgi:hypothetical protein
VPCTGKSSEDEVKLEPELKSTAGTQPLAEENTAVTQPSQPPSSSPSQKQPVSFYYILASFQSYLDKALWLD